MVQSFLFQVLTHLITRRQERQFKLLRWHGMSQQTLLTQTFWIGARPMFQLTFLCTQTLFTNLWILCLFYNPKIPVNLMFPMFLLILMLALHILNACTLCCKLVMFLALITTDTMCWTLRWCLILLLRLSFAYTGKLGMPRILQRMSAILFQDRQQMTTLLIRWPILEFLLK